jgi:regulator of cell morphogenesis and NO signaling
MVRGGAFADLAGRPGRGHRPEVPEQRARVRAARDRPQTGESADTQRSRGAWLDPDALIAEIVAAAATAGPEPGSSNAASLRDLMDGVVSRYHAQLHYDLPHIVNLIERAERAEGARLPGLKQLAQACAELRKLLDEHTSKEERLLFPLIRHLEQGDGRQRLPVVTLEPALAAMEEEHARIEQRLAEIRQLTRGHDAPQEAGQGVRRLYHALKRMDEDLSEHTRLEDEVLFRKALELERRSRSGSGG